MLKSSLQKVIFAVMVSTAVLLLTSCGAGASCEDEDGSSAPVDPPASSSEEGGLSVPAGPGTSMDAGQALNFSGCRLWAKMDGSTATIPLTAAMHKFWDGEGDLPVHNTTSEAYIRLIDKKADLIFVTHPSEDEMQMANDAGVELEVIPVVKDALVFLINAGNPVDNITLSQLRDIYTGKITNWSGLGGDDEDIIPCQRTENSGSQTLLLKLVMDGTAPMTPPSEWISASMGELVEVVSGYSNENNALGYSMFYYVNNMYGNSRFKLLAVEGVKPSRAAIAGGEYPLEDYYYAVIRKDSPSDSVERKLIDWLLTDEGQAVAVRAGYIPLRPIENIGPDGIDPIYSGDTENSSGTGGTALNDERIWGELVVNGVRAPLSDVFYDGFNYIRYINDEIVSQLQDDAGIWFDGSTLEERIVVRPFTGIPNDYPHFVVYCHTDRTILYIEFLEDNPFFNGPMSFGIYLTTDISPYGSDDFSAWSYYNSGNILPNVDVILPHIDMPKSPELAVKINDNLKKWVGSFTEDAQAMKELKDFYDYIYGATGEVYHLLPILSGTQVLYILTSNKIYDEFSCGYYYLLYSTCFDMDTGEIVDPSYDPDYEIDYSWHIMCVCQPISDIISGNGQRVLHGYVPAEGSAITAAWMWGGGLTLLVTEPDGRVLIVFSY